MSDNKPSENTAKLIDIAYNDDMVMHFVRGASKKYEGEKLYTFLRMVFEIEKPFLDAEFYLTVNWQEVADGTRELRWS